MVKEVDILSYLPPVLHEVKEIVEIANVENPVIEALWQEIENTLNNQFVVTANEAGASRYERMLQLLAGETEEIETRRFRILSRYQEQAPYSYIALKRMLDTLLGEGKYAMDRNVAEKWLKVKLELTVKRQFEAVEVLLERVTPQDMLLSVTLRYNQWGTVKVKTWGELKNRTWREVKEEVI